MANKRWTTIDNNFSISFDKNAIIEALDDAKYSSVKSGEIYNFTPIKNLLDIQQKNKLVDVIGVII